MKLDDLCPDGIGLNVEVGKDLAFFSLNERGLRSLVCDFSTSFVDPVEAKSEPSVADTCVVGKRVGLV